MGKIYDSIEGRIAELITRQHVFFVATAPLAGDGLVNVSPKGLDCFRVLGPRTVAYLDLVGSGVETVAHLRENGRITLLFCAFEGPPKIVRLYGSGEAVEPGAPDFDELVAHFPANPATRSIVRVECSRISDSCGFGVPLMSFQGERSQLTAWAQRKGPEAVRDYQRKENLESLDGLPGLQHLSG